MDYEDQSPDAENAAGPATIADCFAAAQEAEAGAPEAKEASPPEKKSRARPTIDGPQVEPSNPRTYRRAGQGNPIYKPGNWVDLSPVVPLGTCGGLYYYLDPLGQVREIGDTHGRSQLISLFAPEIACLENWWPRWRAPRKDEPVSDWIGCNWDHAAIDLISACARRGVWTPFGRQRGIGAWEGEHGELILHCGDHLWQGPTAGEEEGGGGAWLPPGTIGRYVYAAAEAQPRPNFDLSVEDQMKAAHRLGGILAAWRWQRRNDWLLLLGWIGTGLIGGALGWRPAVWLTGDAGTGKSTLQAVVKGVMGETLLQSADASGAGIWQVVGMSSRPVAIDELEPSDNPHRTKAVIDLARQAASGAVILRGGQDHSGQQFRAQSAFLFGSILIPPMTGADRSRLAMLELDPLPTGSRLPDYTPALLAEIGVALRTRLASQWHRLRPLLDQFRAALAALGHVARSADQFGTLLAVAYLLRTDRPLTAERAAEICAPYGALVLNETAEKLADWQDMLLHLGSKRVDAYKGGARRTVSKIIADASADHPQGSAEALAAKDANATLEQFGLKVLRSKDLSYPCPEDIVVAVANKSHSGAGEIFLGTKWAGGVWEQSARRVPNHIVPKSAIRFDGQKHRSTILPLSAVLDPTGASPSPQTGGGPATAGTPQPSGGLEGDILCSASVPPEGAALDGLGYDGDFPDPSDYGETL